MRLDHCSICWMVCLTAARESIIGGASADCSKVVQCPYILYSPVVICYHRQTGRNWRTCSTGQWRWIGETHGCGTREDELALSGPWSRVWLTICCNSIVRGCVVSRWMVEHEPLLTDELCMRRWCSCRLGGHEDRAVGGDARSEAGCIHGRHGHVGIVRGGQSMVWTWVEGHHCFAIHYLLHG